MPQEEDAELIYFNGRALTPQQVQQQCADWLCLFDQGDPRVRDHPAYLHWSRDPSYSWARRTRKNPLR